MKASRLIPLLLLGIPLIVALTLIVRVLYPTTLSYTRLIAVSWGNGPAGPAFYGAYVEAIPRGDVFDNTLTIYIDRPGVWMRHRMAPIALGQTHDEIESVARFGQLEWNETGLTIGNGPQSRRIARSTIENHR